MNAPPIKRGRTDRRLLAQLGVLVVLMFGFGFLLVPLYDVFCELTGVRYTAQATPAREMAVPVDAAREVTVRFIATHDQAAPFEFRPNRTGMTVLPGKLYEATFHTRNKAGRAVRGIATPDVKPVAAVKYFQKTECFCFTPQWFDAGETRELVVRFIIDPDLPAHVEAVTLAYTLYADEQVAAALSE